jgi:hypothetical protein
VTNVVFWDVAPCGRLLENSISSTYTDNKAADFHLNVDKLLPLKVT